MTSWRPAATTAASSPATVSRSATATPGPSPPSTETARSPCPTKQDTATSPSPPTTSATTSGSATPPPSTAGSPTPSTPPSPSPHRPPPAAASTSPPPAAATPTPCASITDSDDIAEARDVLEAVLAADRADVPATTQRRTLAQTVHRPAPTPIRRCEVPEWFPTVLADAQRAPPSPPKTPAAAAAARRAEATAAVAAADATLADVAAATADDRDALRARRSPRRRAPDATTPAHNVASTTAPRRQRRTARHDLDVAERQLERAENYLASTRQRTGPAVERHTRGRHRPARRPRGAPDLRHASTGSTP